MSNEEILALVKENAGLKLGYTKYKRKYKAISRVPHRKAWLRIEGLKVQYVHLAGRLDRATPEEKQALVAVMQHITKERKELEDLYEMCVELGKD